MTSAGRITAISRSPAPPYRTLLDTECWSGGNLYFIFAQTDAERVLDRQTVDGLFDRVVAILEQARSRVVCSVNSEMVIAYWHIGREIVEQEQGGRKRAAYGEAVLEELSRRLKVEIGRGFDVTNLRKMRQFYRMWRRFVTWHVTN